MSLAEDWEDLLDQEVEEISAHKEGTFGDEKILEEKPKQQPAPEKTQPVDPDSPAKKDQTIYPPDNKVVIRDEPIQTIKAEVPLKPNKPTTISNEERRKAELLARLADERNIEDLFEGLSTENKQYTQAQVVLKNDKDFAGFAKTVLERFEEDTESEFLEDFAVELLAGMYQYTKSKDYEQVWEKLKILKAEKKKDEKEKQKQHKKKKETKKEDKPVVEKSRREMDMDDFM